MMMRALALDGKRCTNTEILLGETRDGWRCFPRRCAGRILALDALGLVSLRGTDSGNRPVGGAQITPAGLYYWLISIGSTPIFSNVHLVDEFGIHSGCGTVEDEVGDAVLVGSF